MFVRILDTQSKHAQERQRLPMDVQRAANALAYVGGRLREVFFPRARHFSPTTAFYVASVVLIVTATTSSANGMSTNGTWA